MKGFAIGAVLTLFALSGCQPGGPVVEYGDFSRFADRAWIDTHTHLHSHLKIDDYVAYQDRFGMGRMVLQCLPDVRAIETGGRPNINAEALLAKALYPDRFYVFGGPDLTHLLDGGAVLGPDLEAQVNQLADAGVDGVKLYFRFSVVEPLKADPYNFDYLPDNPALAKLFQTAAARSLPILIHIDAPYLASLEAAMALYPNVTWIVTHLAFTGSNVSALHARLEEALADGYDVYVDVGHFVHLGELLRQDPPAAREFLISHCDRVFQSSDLTAGYANWGLTVDTCPSEEMAVSQTWTLRAMLETSQPITFTSAYTGQEVTIRGLELPEATLRALYHDSAYALLGDPKPVDRTAGLSHIQRLIDHTTLAADKTRLETVYGLFDAAAQP